MSKHVTQYSGYNPDEPSIIVEHLKIEMVSLWLEHRDKSPFEYPSKNFKNFHCNYFYQTRKALFFVENGIRGVQAPVLEAKPFHLLEPEFKKLITQVDAVIVPEPVKSKLLEF